MSPAERCQPRTRGGPARSRSVRRKVAATLAATAAMVLVAGVASCARPAADEKQLIVGISASTLENPFFVRFASGAAAAAKGAGARAMVTDAQNDALTQLNNVQDLITKGADAIILNPVEPESATPAVELANRRNIPVITVDRSSSGGRVISHVASDNVEGGRLICDWLGKRMGGRGEMAVLEGMAGTSPELDRDKGCERALAAYPGIKVVASQPADWDRQKGFTAAQNILQANRTVTAIFGRNDLAALGGAEAAQQAGRRDITVVGFDGIDDALKAIASRQLAATVVQNPTQLGQTALRSSVSAARGKAVPRVQNLPVRVADADNIKSFGKFP